MNHQRSKAARRMRAKLREMSPWFAGPVGLVLHKAKPCNLIPCLGALGFFDVPDDLVREALAA